MRLHEVLALPAVLSGDQWFRPVEWRGSGQAFQVRGDCTLQVPSLRGGFLSMTYGVAALRGEWAVVDAADVHLEG